MSVNSRFMARNGRSCFHSARTKEDGGLQMFLGMCNDTTSRKAQAHSTGLFFLMKCAALGVLLADLFISIFAIYVFRDKLAISATYRSCFCIQKKGKGHGGVGVNKKAYCSSWSGCWMSSRGSPPLGMLQPLYCLSRSIPAMSSTQASTQQ